MKIVLITWRDISGMFGWHSQSQLDNFITDDKESLVHQVGYLYEEDEEQVVLLDSYFEDKNKFGTIHKIPKGCIVKRVVVDENDQSGKRLKR